MKHDQTLRELYQAHLRAKRRQNRITLIITGVTVLFAAAATYTFLRATLDSGMPLQNELSRLPLSQGAIDTCAKLEALHRSIQTTCRSTAMRCFAAPLLIALLLVFALYGYATNRVNTLLMNTPALALQAMQFEKPYLRTVRFWHLVSTLLVSAFLVGAFVLIAHFRNSPGPPWFLKMLVLMVTGAIILASLGWILQGSRRSPHSLVSPLFAQRGACSVLLTIALGALAVVALVGVADFAAFRSSQHLRAKTFEIRSALTILTNDASIHRLPDYDQEVLALVARPISSELDNADESARSLARFGRLVVTREALAWVFFLFCFVAFVSMGPGVLKTEYRRPWIPLLALLVVAVVIEHLGGVFVGLYQDSAWARYMARVAVIAAAFILGQGSAICIRLLVESPGTCPRCAFPVHPSDSCCKECGTRVALLAQGHLIGNIESRELHHVDCDHAKRLPAHKQRMFERADEAYWEGYDNCGACLHGSGYLAKRLREAPPTM